MQDTSDEARLPPSLRLLKTLVTVLTVTLIGGVITIVGLLVTRLQAPEAALPQLPASLQLPEGSRPQAATFGPGWIAVITEGNRLLVFDAKGGPPVQQVDLLLPPAN